MATTTNFGWETPDDTDLVKDGALAIRTLGSAIDTSLVDLKGGTTGQVLSKTSNTDMDFTWVTSDDANAIQNTIVDAKGDLISASAADTPARLAVGNNGESLVADSSATTGLRWTATPSASNPVLNSAFQVWQRGTSILATASANAYQADRWQGYAVSGNITVSQQTTNDTTNLPFIKYCARAQRTAGNTATGAFAISQSFESVNSIAFAGKTVTLSFYARAGANYSATSNILKTELYTGTGTDQNIQSGYTGVATAINQNATLTTTWQRFSYSATLATNTNELAISFTYTPTGTAGAADFFEITGVQLDVGSVALPFRTNGGTFAGELAACQRYYYLHASGNGQAIGNASYYVSTEVDGVIHFPVPMRTAPTIDQVTGTDYYHFFRNNASDTFNSFTVSYASPRAVNLYNGAQVSGTAGQGGIFVTANNASYLGFTAEL